VIFGVPFASVPLQNTTQPNQPVSSLVDVWSTKNFFSTNIQFIQSHPVILTKKAIMNTDNSGIILIVILCVSIAWLYFTQTGLASTSAPSSQSSQSVSPVVAGKMGSSVYVERDDDGIINLSEISASRNGVKYTAVSGGVEKMLGSYGWQYLVDGDPETFAHTIGGGKVWIGFGKVDVLIDKINIVNRPPTQGQMAHIERIRGARVSLRKVDGSITWQTTIKTAESTYEFNLT
jgi:hypothetical protein